MSDIRQILAQLADSLEEQAKKQPTTPVISDRSLSGNKIHGGIITNFSSVGIRDESTNHNVAVLRVANDGVHVSVIHAGVIANPLTVKGNLSVEGEVHARKLHVDEISADVRNERTSPLEFKSDNSDPAYGKGLIWPAKDYTRQFVLQVNPDRLFSSESLDVHRGKSYMVQGQSVLSLDTLGPSVTKSSLKNLGTLESLTVSGPVNIDSYLFYDPDTQRLGLGTDAPNGLFSAMSWDHEFIIDPTEDRKFKIGTWTTTALQLVTDDTTRIEIAHNGIVTFENKVVLKHKLGVGVKNFEEDADITTAGPVRFQNKKFEVGTKPPGSGSYRKGDIVWNENPVASGSVGWICIREGTPGEWKSFGQIAS